MSEDFQMFPEYTRETTKVKEELTPEHLDAWRNFSRSVYHKGELDKKTKQLIAVAVAHVTQCPYCIRAHVPQAIKAGATKQEVMEAIWVASEMRAGAASAHSVIAIDAMKDL